MNICISNVLLSKYIFVLPEDESSHCSTLFLSCLFDCFWFAELVRIYNNSSRQEFHADTVLVLVCVL